MHCNSCGTLNQPSSHFCVKCGANLDAQRAVQSALAASPPVQTGVDLNISVDHSQIVKDTNQLRFLTRMDAREMLVIPHEA